MDHATVRLLKDRFDLADGEAEHILGSFVEAVEQNLEEFGICHVTGVGSFVRAPGDSKISFEPADALRRAVNVRFADLPVYEIDSGAASRPDSDSPSAGSTAESRTAPPRGTPPPPVRDRTPDRTRDRPLGRPAENRQPDAETPNREIPSTESKVTDSSPAASSSAEPVPRASSPSAASPTDPPNSSRPQRTGSRAPHKRRQRSSGGSKTVWFVLPLLIALVAAGVWFIQRPASDPAPVAEEIAPTVPEPGVDSGADAVPDTDDPAPQDATPGQAQADSDPPAEVEPPQQEAADIAADDAVDDAETSENLLNRNVDGYTMIVGSSPDRTAADEQISRFTELDLPYGVLDYSEDGSPMYRLAVGLFDSAEQADSVRQAMADTLPSGTWVWRIR